MTYIYKSIFSIEMVNYLQLLSNNGKYILQVQSSLRSLDKYLDTINYNNKSLPAGMISSWLKTREVSAKTKIKNLSHMRGFTKYLNSIQISASYPDSYKFQDDYIPYVFSDDEIERIIMAADSVQIQRKFSRPKLIFPFLLRLLIGCGLRLGEGLNLRWKNIDFENGILTITKAKNLKQRFVPMDSSLTEVLKIYKKLTEIEGISITYLFESDINPNSAYKNNTFYRWFMEVLETAEITYVKENNRKRGPCPHCLRHYFTMKSFLESEKEGRKFEDSAPFLAAYLGHDSVKETEAYLRANYSIYTASHQRVNDGIGHLFPEVIFFED